jgi:hypothetical protein
LGGFGGRPLGCAQLVRSCLDLAAVWRVFGSWMFCPEVRVGGVRVGGVRVVAGRVGADGWVGGQVAMQCVVDIVLLLWWQMRAAAGRRGWAGKSACMFVRTLLAASDIWGRVVVR